MMNATSTAAQDAGATQTYDVVVLGGGPVGTSAAMRALAGGLSAVVVEAELVGGECGNWACIPSKALLRPGRARDAACRVPGAREAVTGDIDGAAALARRDEMVSHHDDSAFVRSLQGAGLGFVRGHGRLGGPRRVVVTTAEGSVLELVATGAVVLATGSTAAVPPIPGLQEACPWTNRQGTGAEHVPRRLVVLGGGPVGLELAQAWKSLGSEEVVVLAHGTALLPQMESFVGELVLAGLRGDGIDVRLDTDAVQVERAHPGNEVIVHLADGTTVAGDELLVATGRQPLTSDVGLETVGLAPGGYVPVDPQMRAEGTDWLYAIGDVNGHALLTHQGKYQGRVAVDGVLAHARGEQPPYAAEADEAAVPQVIFTDPEVGTVGLTSDRAAARGLRVRSVEADFGEVPGAILYAKGYTGRAALVIDEDAQVVVGATFVGQDVAEMVHAATVAVAGRVPLERLRHVIPSFPTMSEVWLLLLDAYGPLTRAGDHAPLVHTR